MPSYLILRLISFVIAIFLPAVLSTKFPFAIVGVPLTISHYLLSLPYSRNQLSRVMKGRKTALIFWALVPLTLAIGLVRIPYSLFAMFAVHHVFNEVYMVHENSLSQLWHRTRALRVSSLIYNFFVYFTAFRPDAIGHSQLYETIAFSGVFASGCFFAFQLYRLRGLLTRNQMTQTCLYELLGLGFVVLSVFYSLPFQNVVFYHVVFWLLYPCLKMQKNRQTNAIFTYIALNFAITASIILFSPVSGFPIHFSTNQILTAFTYGSIWHILATFMLSSAQPAWITRLFNPQFQRASGLPPIDTPSIRASALTRAG